MRKKTGSNVITTCPTCGRQFTRAGLIGHMRFKHGQDYKNPAIKVKKPLDLKQARSIIHDMASVFENNLPPSPCCQAKLWMFTEDRNELPDKRPMVFFCEACENLWELHPNCTNASLKGDKIVIEYHPYLNLIKV